MVGTGVPMGNWEQNQLEIAFPGFLPSALLRHPPAWAGVPEVNWSLAPQPGREIGEIPGHLVTLEGKSLSFCELPAPPTDTVGLK